MSGQSLPEIVLVAQNIRSLYNVGSLFRTADGLGVTKIFLTGYTGMPPQPQISKTALGAELNVPWQHARQTLPVLRQLRRDGFTLLALETGRSATPLPQLQPSFPVALILGNEVRGLTSGVRAFADRGVAIPMLGRKESYNVSVAAGMALYALRYGSKKSAPYRQAHWSQIRSPRT